MAQPDEYGIERATPDKPGMVAKYRQKWPWFDHLMLMQERYQKLGGNQYSAGITYFSVLSIFPLLMLAFASMAMILANRPETLADIQSQITDTLSGQLGETVNSIVDTAIEQRGAIAGIGGLTALWSGLGWMNNLRYGVSKMWKYPVVGGNFALNKLKDLLGLLVLMVSMAVAFGITAVGSSKYTMELLGFLHIDDAPGAVIVVRVVSILVGLVANYLVFFCMIKYLPRGPVPVKAAAKAAVIGAVAFEAFKQLGSMFFSNALSNPAGATFGPIIGVMVLLYFVWRILLYCSAWAATTPEALGIATLDAPPPAVIRVREEVAVDPKPSAGVGRSVAIGAAGAGLFALLRRK